MNARRRDATTVKLKGWHGILGRQWTTGHGKRFSINVKEGERASFEGDRELGLHPPKGWLQEELWMCLVGDDIWDAAGDGQDARKDALVVSLADMEAIVVREMLGLHFGIIWGDRRDAFDTAWSTEPLIRLWDAGVGANLHSVSPRHA